MKLTITQFKAFFATFFFVVSFGMLSFSQAATATWALTSNGNAAVSGNITATAVTHGVGYRSGGISSMSYGSNGVSSTNWISYSYLSFDVTSSYYNQDYYQYTVSPTTGNNLTVTSINYTASASSSSPSSFLYYSLNNFATYTAVGGVDSYTNTGLNIVVPSGSTLTVRVFGMDLVAATTAFRNKNVVISGTTTSNCVAPGVPSFTSGATTICEGQSSTYAASATGTTPTMSYSILSGGASIDANSGVVSNVASSYTVRATANNGCGTTTNDRIVTVNTNPSAPTISADGATNFCAGGNVNLTASLSSGITWSNTATSQQINVTTSGNYTATVTDGNGCTATSSPLTVTVNPIVTPSFAPVSPICSGSSLSALPNTDGFGITGTWSPALNNAQTTTYSFTPSAGQCANMGSLTVVVNPNPAIPTISADGPLTFCEGADVVLTSSASNGNAWSNSTSNQSITVTTAGSYSVTVTDVNGCTASSTPTVVNVNANPATPTISADGPLTFCEGADVVLTSSASNGNTWSNSNATSSITVTTSGNYTVTVLGGNGCSATSAPTAVTVNQSPATPTISADGPLTFCAGDNVVLTSSSATGNTWSNSSTSQAITVSTAGNYTVTVANGNGCTATSFVQTVVVNAVPVAGASSTGAITITATPAGQNYQWINCTNNQAVSGANAVTFQAAANGNYAVIVTNSNGCKDTSSCVTVSKVSLDELNADLGLSLYPNPTNGKVSVSLEKGGFVQVSVYDFTGHLVLDAGKMQNNEVIDLSAFYSGVYVVKATNESGANAFRIVKE